ncbi:hypothetical protein J2046_006238 [Rhizobium petrolearium]|uniref:Major facilitator superfamily (MFS) profile domain-containing protein n=1 Tax=Neorhizobium petrolearium TaxID=515361 RepID=A0ABY8M9B9_9HYPH|nr:hypothetical protein [Neorhizobium petrolearium]MBP1847953.1 hypothetical protein [Neorhizobium petrolearium]MCC2609839.1 hypothetical protein [Neorhizobium petrolearium]WGI70025.1 hypothetical protein QEO92_08280 [Neorhizobium petrolearium]
MPALISYILIRVSIGFALGAATAVAILTQSLSGSILSIGLLEIWLTIYGFGSVFGLGYLATSLAFDAEE